MRIRLNPNAVLVVIAAACGSVTEPPPPPPPTPAVSIEAPSQAELPGPVPLRWACRNVTSCVGSWTQDPIPLSGEALVPLKVEGDNPFVVTAQAGGKTYADTTVTLGVLPKVSGYLAGFLPEGIGNPRIYLLPDPASKERDSVDVAGPNWSVPNRFWRSDSAVVFVPGNGSATGEFFPFARKVARNQTGVGIWRLPRVCRPPYGEYAGMEYEMSLEREAYAEVGIGVYRSSFLRRDSTFKGWSYRYQTAWSSYPITVAIDRDSSDIVFADEDSVMISRDVVDALNREIPASSPIFRMGDFSEVGYPNGSKPKGILVRVKNGLGNSAPYWGILVEVVAFRPWTVKHELVHHLNIGHHPREAWVGLMNPGSSPDPASEKLGIQGACYLWLFLRGEEFYRSSGRSLVPAYGDLKNGERLVMGLTTLEPVAR